MIQKEKKFDTIDTPDKVKRVCEWLADKQGRDVLGLNVRGISSAFDAMILVTARSVRHAQALADNVLKELKDANFEYLGMEGYKTGQWVLMDLNDVVVHIFLADLRGFFDLEGLWAEADTICHLESTPEGDEDRYHWEEQ
jgi:ribosome-associated protein